MKKLFPIIIFISLLACKKDNIANKTTQTIQKDTLATNLKSNKLQIITSENFNDDWSELISFETELKRVVSKPINSEKDIELLLKLLSDIKKTYPEKFKTPGIEARVKVLETSILMFSLNLKEGILENVDKNILEIKTAHNNFVNKIKTHILKEKDYEKYK